MIQKNIRRSSTQAIPNTAVIKDVIPEELYHIPNRCSNLIKANALCYNNQEGRDSQLRPSGMTPYFIATRGFTLIELLVVVLIIGILAAVAVPQYKMAVIKSRVSTYLPLMKAISEAETVYYMSTGKSSKDVSKLDVDIPNSCTPLAQEGQRMFACGNDILFDNSNLEVILSYCPDNNTDHTQCKDNRDFFITFYDSNYKQNSRKCTSAHNSALGEKICKSLGTKTKNGGDYYELN